MALINIGLAFVLFAACCSVSCDLTTLSFPDETKKLVSEMESIGEQMASKASGAGEGDWQLAHEKKLKDKLFAGYDKEVRPVFNHKNETRVDFGFAPQMVIDLDEERALFSIDGWLLLNWMDGRLAWNSSEYDGLTKLNLQDHKVWQPDITVYNGPSAKTDPKKNTHILLFSSGHLWFVPPTEIQTFCPMVLDKSYPKDIVYCDVYFGSWSHDGWQINLTLWNGALDLENLENSNPRWQVMPELSTINRIVNYYNCCEEPYMTIEVSFALRRRPPPELDVIWSPCVLVMCLTLTMFWIPSGSGKKILLGLFLFLVLNVLTVYVGAATRSPRAAKYAVAFLESTMYAVASAVILEVLVINLCSIIGPCRPPSRLVQFLSGPLGKYVGVWPQWITNVPGDRLQLKEDLEQVERHPTTQDEWILVATALDRLLFVLYIIILATIHQV